MCVQDKHWHRKGNDNCRVPPKPTVCGGGNESSSETKHLWPIGNLFEGDRIFSPLEHLSSRGCQNAAEEKFQPRRLSEKSPDPVVHIVHVQLNYTHCTPASPLYIPCAQDSHQRTLCVGFSLQRHHRHREIVYLLIPAWNRNISRKRLPTEANPVTRSRTCTIIHVAHKCTPLVHHLHTRSTCKNSAIGLRKIVTA